MDYFGIIKKAYQITLKHKFLWLFGILAGGSAGIRGNSFQYAFSGSDKLNNLGSSSFENFWTQYNGLIVIIGLVFLAFLVFMFVLSVVSQGALIGSAAKLGKDEKSNFFDGFMVGWHNFWRIWAVAILYLLMFLASLVVWLGPAIALAISGATVFAWLWGILLFFVVLASWILIGLISPYSIRVVVLKKLGIFASIRDSVHLFQDKWANILVMYLLLSVFSIAFGLAFVFVLLILGGILFAIGYGMFLASVIAAVIYSIIFGLALLVVLITLGGAYGAFASSVYTLTYLEVAKS